MLLCISVVKHERIKFLAVALRDAIEVYAWAPKPYNKFMSFKVTLYFLNLFIIYVLFVVILVQRGICSITEYPITAVLHPVRALGCKN